MSGFFQMQMVTPNAPNFVWQTNFCLGGRGYPKFRHKKLQKKGFCASAKQYGVQGQKFHVCLHGPDWPHRTCRCPDLLYWAHWLGQNGILSLFLGFPVVQQFYWLFLNMRPTFSVETSIFALSFLVVVDKVIKPNYHWVFFFGTIVCPRLGRLLRLRSTLIWVATSWGER